MKALASKNKRVPINITLPFGLRDKLINQAVLENLTISSLVERILTPYLDEAKTNKTK